MSFVDMLISEQTGDQLGPKRKNFLCRIHSTFPLRFRPKRTAAGLWLLSPADASVWNAHSKLEFVYFFPEWSLRESSPLSLEVFMLSSIRLSADSVLCATVAEWNVSLSSPFQLCDFYSRAAFFRLGQRVEPSHLGLSELCQQSALFEFVPENVAAV